MTLIELVKVFEGFHRVTRRGLIVTATPYLCPANVWTQGYGHVCREGAPGVTEPEAAVVLAAALGIAHNALLRLTKPLLTTGQTDALTSWVFNLGSGRYRGSTLRAVLNRGEFDLAPGEMRKWIYGGGRKLPGLILRREAEIALWHS